MFVCCECCVLSDRRSLCDEVITRPEKSYREWCVVVCDLETSGMRRPWSTGGLLHQIKKNRARIRAGQLDNYPGR
jgi:DTW domain-containing protein YfiP